TLTRPFYLGVFPVTQEEYQKVAGTNPSAFSPQGGSAGSVPDLDTRRFPVEKVNWLQATSFCARLSELAPEREAGRVSRLPTEAEWEYAARGGCNWSLQPEAVESTAANFDGTSPARGTRPGPYLQRPTPVGSYLPNVLGLYDLLGNVWEWC